MGLKFKNQKKSLPQLTNHIGFTFQNNLILHGGMNENNEVEGKWYVINILTEVCEEITIESELKSLCYHSCVTIGNQNNQKIFTDKFSNENKECEKESQEFSPRIIPSNRDYSEKRAFPIELKEPEFLNDFMAFIFGGMNQSFEIKNDLFMVEFLNGSMKIAKLITSGNAPCPRYANGMTFVSGLQAIAVFGGIGKIQNDEVYFNDLHLFFVSSSIWAKVQTDPRIEPRAFMSICEYKSTGIIIFGGSGVNNFLDANFHIFRLTDETEKYLTNSSIETSGIDYFLKTFCSEKVLKC